MTNLHLTALNPSVNTDRVAESNGDVHTINDGAHTLNDTGHTPHTNTHTTHIVNNLQARRLRKKIAIAVGLLFAAGIVVRVIVNASESAALAAATNASLERTVMTTQAKLGALKSALVLPTTLRGNSETTLVARSNGYVVAIKKDIGDSVKQGDVLATLAAPEQDQELALAQANYAQVQGRTDLAQLTADRYESLRLKDGISQHELDEKRSELLQQRANLAAAQAEVNRLEQLRGLRTIVAPFSGVITHRAVDIGDLVTAGNKPLFSLTQIDPLKLTIWLPQASASQIKIGQNVKIKLNEYQQETFDAKVDRVAGGIDSQTRSRQVDLLLPNNNGRLLPGAYAEAHIELAKGGTGSPVLIAPSSVLKSTSDGYRIAVVDGDNRVAFRDIKIGKDLGREIEVLDGISETDTLVVSPSDLLADGEIVKTVVWQPKQNDKNKTAEKNSASDKKPSDDKNRVDDKNKSKDASALTRS